MTTHIEIDAASLDFEKIMKYKPFFFFFHDEPVRSVLLQGSHVEMQFSQAEPKAGLRVAFNKELGEPHKKYLANRISYCFGTNEDLRSFYAVCEHDMILSKFLDKIEGNRLISAFDDFEAIVSIICSQNVSFAQYKDMVAKLVKAYGYKGCFPAPRDIISKPHLMADCGVGYRGAFIMEAAKKMHLNPLLSDDDLINMHGIGPYSRDIFRLFQRRDYSAFYVDTLIRKIFKEQYGANLETDADVRRFADKLFGKFAGLAEIYLQKFLNDNPFFNSPKVDAQAH